MSAGVRRGPLVGLDALPFVDGTVTIRARLRRMLSGAFHSPFNGKRSVRGPDGSSPRLDLAAARRTFESYRGTSLATRIYVVGRLGVAPLGCLAQEVDSLDGRLLSLGTGLGVVERYLADANRSLVIDGVDLDPDKVAIVAATRGSSPRVKLRHGDATRLTEAATYDVVLICDLLHHLRAAEQHALASVAVSAVRAGGTVIVKDLDVRPHWKHGWNRWHDRLVAGPEPILCRSPEVAARMFREAGLVLEQSKRIDRPWTPYAHYLLRLRK
jgi:2-polyprenyl-3-methyl-5-hydroxy-6-metoxy-1,4-benzoquinol methylase